jgi:hypothetical protein
MRNATTNTALVSFIGDDKSQAVTIKLPLGLLFQPHRVVAITAGVAYRLGITLTSGPTIVTHALPIDGELLVNVVRQLDFGFDFELGGPLAVNASGRATNVASSFADLRVFSFFFQGRI